MKTKILIPLLLILFVVTTLGIVVLALSQKSGKELFSTGKPSILDSLTQNKSADSKSGDTKPVDTAKPFVKAPDVSKMAVQAWVYPGPPSCTAMLEISDGRKIDVLKAEYFSLDDTGKIKLLTEANDGCNGFSIANVMLLKRYSTYQFVTVSTDHLSMRLFFSDKSKYSSGITTLVDFVNKYDLNGVEIDFEDFSAWTDQDYYNYKTFLTDLSAKLHTVDKYLMIDGPPLTQSSQKDYKWDYKDINALPVDYIVVMAYDYQYDEGKGTFVAPNNWVKQIYEYVAEQVDEHKLTIGIPSYGYHTDDKGRILLDTAEQSKRLPGNSSAKFSEDAFEYYWEFDSQFYTTQRKEGLSKKVSFVTKLGAKSISIWHLGGNPWFN
jgi:spore germination protein YaaH